MNNSRSKTNLTQRFADTLQNRAEKKTKEQDESQKNRSNNNLGTIELHRLRIKTVHYLFLGIWVLCMFAGGYIIFSDTYYKYLLSGIADYLLLIAFASTMLTLYCWKSAKEHSKTFDTNITHVFEYMLRRDKVRFSYKHINDSYRSVFHGPYDLRAVVDDKDNDEVEYGSVSIAYTKAPRLDNQVLDFSEKFTKISEIDSIVIGNQNLSIKDEVFLEKNRKIREMLISDRSQLIAFVAAYIFSTVGAFALAALM